MHDFGVFMHHLFHTAHCVRWALSGLVAILLLLAILVAWAEDITLGDALCFTPITGFTVGYGDLVPTSAFGRVLSVLAALVGVVLSGIYVAVATRAVARTWDARTRAASAPPAASAADQNHS